MRPIWTTPALALCGALSACVGLIGGADDPGVDASTRDARGAVDAVLPGDAAGRADRATPPVDAGPPPPPPYPGVPGVSPTLGGCPVFPPDDPWNRDITSAPVRADSAAILANIRAHGDDMLRPDFGSNPAYGIPITLAPASQPPVPLEITKYPDESDHGPFPIPDNARIEGGGDDHVLVVHQGACVLYELYRAQHNGGRWSAGAAARFDLRTNTERPQTWTSADQAGLPITPGLARYEEVAAGEIRHALRVTFNHTRAAWIRPATHPGGENDRTAPPMGLRLRMRASYDIGGLTGQARVIAEALKRYGLFVADTGTNWFISGDTDRRWVDRDLAQLRDIPGSAFEVLDTGPLLTR
ncbi:MAG: hypothetical protein R3A48_01430 [Polyangiales bacterium]